MDRVDQALNNHMAAIMDVPGFNYRSFRYQEAYEKLPQQIVLGSETTSALSSRGVYKFPVERKSMAMYDDHQASSYDLEHASWSNLPEDDFILHDDLLYHWRVHLDRLRLPRRPTPYYSHWPSHSSFSGQLTWPASRRIAFIFTAATGTGRWRHSISYPTGTGMDAKEGDANLCLHQSSHGRAVHQRQKPGCADEGSLYTCGGVTARRLSSRWKGRSVTA